MILIISKYLTIFLSVDNNSKSQAKPHISAFHISHHQTSKICSRLTFTLHVLCIESLNDCTA